MKRTINLLALAATLALIAAPALAQTPACDDAFKTATYKKWYDNRKDKQEIAFQVARQEDTILEVTSVENVSSGIRIRFSRPVNPLTLRRGGLRLLRSDGTQVNFTLSASLDGTEVMLVPSSHSGALTIVHDKLEGRDGKRVPT